MVQYSVQMTTYTNNARLPRALYWALTHDDYEAEEGSVGVTTLIDAPRAKLLQQRHSHQIERDAADNTYLLLGKAVHALIEKSPHGISETRMCAEVPGCSLRLCGIPDNVDPPRLWDFKTSSVWIHSLGIRWEWEAQLNCYRWLLRQKEVLVDELGITVIFRDYSNTDATRRDNYPPHQAMVYTVPTWTLAETGAFIVERMAAYEAALETPDDLLPQCSPAERWQQDAAFAVYQGSKKRAERVLPSVDEAVKWIATSTTDGAAQIYGGGVSTYDRLEDVHDERGYYVVRRPEVWKRCDGYCDAAPFCNQYREHCTGGTPDPDSF